ncbi:MAG TPA: hypothetical protein PLN42_01110, partial [Anaerolineae bacterium]|nr:hypothetical protein [Anaerolineae bacterium]
NDLCATSPAALAPHRLGRRSERVLATGTANLVPHMGFFDLQLSAAMRTGRDHNASSLMSNTTCDELPGDDGTTGGTLESGWHGVKR